MLTSKELEILKLRNKGLTQAEIAKKLGISQPAVSAFERSIARKIRDSVETLELIKELGVDMGKYKSGRR